MHIDCLKDFIKDMIFINDHNVICNSCNQSVKEHMYDQINFDLCISCYKVVVNMN